MALTPEEIADKDFPVGLRGYDQGDVRAFLRTVADTVRELASAPPPPAPAPEPAPEPTPVPEPTAASAPAATPDPQPAAPSPGPSGGTDWADLGEEIAAVLRTAHEQAASLRADAERAAQATGAAAAAEAEATRAAAEADRADAATRLAGAQNEALGLVADAQARVERMLETSKERAEQEASAAVAHLTAQIGDLTATRDRAKADLGELKTSIDAVLGSPDRPTPHAGLCGDCTDETMDAEQRAADGIGGAL